MQNAEYQTLRHVLSQVWVKVMGNTPENLSESNCKLIAEKVNNFFGWDAISAKSIHRISQLNHNSDLSQNRKKDVLAYYIRGLKIREGQVFSKLIFEEMVKRIREQNISLQPYEGTYKIYSQYLNNLESNKWEEGARIVLEADGKACFLSEDESFEGEAEFKNGQLYFTFQNSFETIYLVVKVGLTVGQKYLAYLIGMFSGVRDKLQFPYSMFVVLYREAKNSVLDLKRINAVFNYVAEKHFISVDQYIL